MTFCHPGAKPSTSSLPAAPGPRWRVWAGACALLLTLAACGGGGGGGGGSGGGSSGGGPSFQLSFQPGTVTANYYQGEPPVLSVQVRASQAHSAPVQVTVIDSNGVTDGSLQLQANADLSYTAVLRLSPTAPPGSYSGSLDVRVCEDAPLTCARPVPGSPWKLPYQIQVRPPTDPRPISPLPGVAAWTGALGGGANNAYRAIPSDVSAFSRRWLGQSLSVNAREGLAVSDGGLVVTIARELTGGLPTLIARREADASVAWLRPLGSASDVTDAAPVLAQGQVFVFASDFSRTVLWRFDLNTGALLGERSFPRASSSQPSALYHAGQLYTCRRPVGSGFGLTRFDASTLQAEVVDTSTDYADSCQPSTDGQRVYVFRGRRLLAYTPGQAQPVLGPEVDGVPLGAATTPVLDGAGRAYVAVFTSSSALEGNGSLLAFDTASGQLLWQQRGGFGSAPVLANGTLYVTQGQRLEARSPATGAVLWSVAGNSPSGLGNVSSPVVATNSLVFLASNWTVDAFDPATRSVVWSENYGGSLALSPQGLLLVQPSFSGSLRAINLR